MSDITNNNLGLAFLDQKVEGLFGGKPHAYVVVLQDDGTWGIGIAVLDERGYHPITGMRCQHREEAQRIADGMNDHIKVPEWRATEIQVSSMRAVR